MPANCCIHTYSCNELGLLYVKSCVCVFGGCCVFNVFVGVFVSCFSYCMIFPHHIVHIEYVRVSVLLKGKKRFAFPHNVRSNTFVSCKHSTHTQTSERILLSYMNKCSTAITTKTTTSKSLSQIYCSNNTSHERFDCNSWARNTHRDTRRPSVCLCMIRKIDQKLLRAHRYSRIGKRSFSFCRFRYLLHSERQKNITKKE